LGDYQGTAVVNFPEESVPQTRIHEFKHLRPESQGSSRKTVLSAEFASSNGEPAYPADPEGKLVRLYWEAAALEPDVYFLGRLARYKYLDMDEAVAEALELAGELCMT
jgi:UDP-galactopyranose mutase